MLAIQKIDVPGYELVIEGIDPEVNLHCFIAVQSTKLGPALGGVRIFPYTSRDAALEDALRLAKAMTVKSALAELELGGGKSVIIADSKKEKTKEMLLKFAEVVETLKGIYIVAEDVGSSVDDMLIIREKTSYVSAMPTKESSGDPSPFTAFGVLKGIQSAEKILYGSNILEGKSVAIQGLGHVGSHLAELLFFAGAKLFVADIDQEKAREIARKYGGTTVRPEEIHKVPCDVFSPCALGGILSEKAILELRCKAVAGSANNQLESDELDILLFKRKILYAPDFAINAGGLINVSLEFSKEGYNPKKSLQKVNKIFHTLSLIFYRSESEARGTNSIALDLANENLMQKSASSAII